MKRGLRSRLEEPRFDQDSDISWVIILNEQNRVSIRPSGSGQALHEGFPDGVNFFKSAANCCDSNEQAPQIDMNADILKGQWKELKGDAKSRWAKITDDEWQGIEGSFDKLVGAIQKAYGESKEEAQKQARDWSPMNGR